MGKIEDKDIDLHIDRETLLQEYIPKAQYEARLKADMVAMLEDLRLAIEELDYPKDCDHACNGCLYWGDVDKLIDEKIKALKGENETC